MIWSGLPWWFPLAIGAFAGAVVISLLAAALLAKVGTKSTREKEAEAETEVWRIEAAWADRALIDERKAAAGKPMRRRETR